MLQNVNWENVNIMGAKTLILQNTRGYNYDKRGSNKCDLYLEFYEEKEIALPVTLKQLADAFFRIKSHKFDSWYELYCGCKKVVSKNGVVLKVNFDHGS